MKVVRLNHHIRRPQAGCLENSGGENLVAQFRTIFHTATHADQVSLYSRSHLAVRRHNSRGGQ